VILTNASAPGLQFIDHYDEILTKAWATDSKFTDHYDEILTNVWATALCIIHHYDDSFWKSRCNQIRKIQFFCGRPNQTSSNNVELIISFTNIEFSFIKLLFKIIRASHSSYRTNW